VHSFTDSDFPDTDKIVLFKNTTSINLIDLLCVILFCFFYFGNVIQLGQVTEGLVDWKVIATYRRVSD